MTVAIPRAIRDGRRAGAAMLLALALGMIAANSSLSDGYAFLHHNPLRLGLAELQIEAPLIDWINQGLLTVFFFQIGLHTNQEITTGVLASPCTAAVPAAAALGGMILPAAVYTLFNFSDPVALNGWAIPIATDIVLVLGLMSLFGGRVAPGVIAFITATAIFDDLGAVIVIALFYGEVAAVWPVAVIIAGLLTLFALNRCRYAHLAPYLLAGAVLWTGLIATGLEGAAAGAVVGLSLPLSSFQPHTVTSTMRRISPIALFFVVPMFAFFNGGVPLDLAQPALAIEPIALGIGAALVLGKPLGVLLGTLLAVRLGIGSLPAMVTARDIALAALLAGVGFTMSLFIVTAAFHDPLLADTSKLAVLAGSALSAVIALIALMTCARKTE